MFFNMTLNRANTRAGGGLCKRLHLQRGFVQAHMLAETPPLQAQALAQTRAGFSQRRGGVSADFRKLGPQTRLARHGSSCNAGCTKSHRSKSRTCVPVCSGAVRRDPEEQGRNPRNTHPEVIHLRNCRKTNPNLARASLCAPGRSGEIRMNKAIPMG